MPPTVGMSFYSPESTRVSVPTALHTSDPPPGSWAAWC